jgi:hypothetical protein
LSIEVKRTMSTLVNIKDVSSFAFITNTSGPTYEI